MEAAEKTKGGPKVA